MERPRYKSLTELVDDRHLESRAVPPVPRRAVAAVLRPAGADRTESTRRRVADLGCGTGELTAEAHAALAARETVGIDTSAKMLGEASQLHVDGLSFREGDLAEFSDADGFDVIISNAALHWVPDHERVLARWRDALTSEGQLAVQMPTNADHPSHVIAREVAEEEPFLSAFDGSPPLDPVLARARGRRSTRRCSTASASPASTCGSRCTRITSSRRATSSSG